jgi:hypothetical protein
MLHGPSRRFAMATSAALLLGLSTAATAQATCGANAILGANSCNGITTLTGSFLGDLLKVTNSNAGGSAIRGESAATAANAFGIVGSLTSTAPGANATAVRGINAGTNANGSGVYGSHAGSGRGVRGTSVLGDGIFGSHLSTSGTGAGVRGESASTAGSAVGIIGTLTSTAPGSGATAVRGLNAGTNANGSGVYGSHAGSGTGVRATSVGGDGVFGSHLSTSGTAAGVRGETASTAASSVGVLGKVAPTLAGAFSAGVRGINHGTTGLGIGVYGSHAGGGWGVYGTTPAGVGVRGESDDGTGVEAAATGNNPALRATNTGSGPAAAFSSSGTPFTVDSSTRVDSLNADQLDGLHAGDLGGRTAVGAVITYNNGGTFTQQASIQIDAPTDGLILVNGSVMFDTLMGGRTSCNPCVGVMRLRDTVNDAKGSEQAVTFGDGTHEVSAQVGTSWAFPVTAGRQTIALETVGTVTDEIFADNPTLTALFVPFGPSGAAAATAKATVAARQLRARRR